MTVTTDLYAPICIKFSMAIVNGYLGVYHLACEFEGTDIAIVMQKGAHSPCTIDGSEGRYDGFGGRCPASDEAGAHREEYMSL